MGNGLQVLDVYHTDSHVHHQTHLEVSACIPFESLSLENQLGNLGECSSLGNPLNIDLDLARGDARARTDGARTDGARTAPLLVAAATVLRAAVVGD